MGHAFEVLSGRILEAAIDVPGVGLLIDFNASP